MFFFGYAQSNRIKLLLLETISSSNCVIYRGDADKLGLLHESMNMVLNSWYYPKETRNKLLWERLWEKEDEECSLY